MKIRNFVAFAILSSCLWAQTPAAPAVPPARPRRMDRTFNVMVPREMGKWWKNSDIVKKLELDNGQLSQLDQIFVEHKLKLIDYGAEMEKQDLKLQTLLDADTPNEGQVGAQVDQVLAARGKLEREFTMMNLDLRKVLSIDQWRQLKTIRGEGGGVQDQVFFLRKALPPGQPALAPLPPLPPVGALPMIPEPPSDDRF